MFKFTYTFLTLFYVFSLNWNTVKILFSDVSSFEENYLENTCQIKKMNISWFRLFCFKVLSIKQLILITEDSNISKMHLRDKYWFCPACDENVSISSFSGVKT